MKLTLSNIATATLLTLLGCSSGLRVNADLRTNQHPSIDRCMAVKTAAERLGFPAAPIAVAPCEVAPGSDVRVFHIWVHPQGRPQPMRMAFGFSEYESLALPDPKDEESLEALAETHPTRVEYQAVADFFMNTVLGSIKEGGDPAASGLVTTVAQRTQASLRAGGGQPNQLTQANQTDQVSQFSQLIQAAQAARQRASQNPGVTTAASPPSSTLTTWPNVATPLSDVTPALNDSAVVVAIEKYAFLSPVPGARDNAEAWYQYFTKTLKIPPDRVRLLLDADATREEIVASAQTMADTSKPGGRTWFVYIGHGAPNQKATDGLLVSVDAQQKPTSLESRGVPQSELLGTLAKGRGTPVAIIDACYSGKTGSGQLLVPGLQPSAVVKSAVPQRAVVLSAARSDQYAGPLPGTSRPAFSYLTLGALRGWADDDHDGRVTAREIVGYTDGTLRVTLAGSRNQTPELSGGNNDSVLATAHEAGPDLADIVLQLKRGGSTQPTSPSTNQTSAQAAPSGVCEQIGIDVCKRECASGNGERCYNLGYSYLYGQGVERNPPQAMDLFKQACARDSADGCNGLGTILFTGVGVPTNLEAAFSYFERACRDGSAKGCYNQGNSLKRGAGTALNLQRAGEAYVRSCKLGLPLGCDSARALGVTP